MHTYQVNANNHQSAGGSWVSVSTMQNTDAVIEDENKTCFDWCKEGNVQQMTALLRKGAMSINTPDDTVSLLL